MIVLNYLFLSVVFTVSVSFHLRTWPSFSLKRLSDDNQIYSNRIVGGDNFCIKDVPYQVSFQKHEEHFCGGALITRMHVVTAAHCTYDTQTEQNHRYEDLSVRAGSTYRDRGGIVAPIEFYVMHPKFSSATVDYDIAIIKLTKRLPVNGYIRPIPVAGRNDHFPTGTTGLITGWGVQGQDMAPDSAPSILQGVNVQVIDRDACRQVYGPETITDRMTCAYAEGKDSCQGDSGGPFVIQGVLAGIVSFGSGCARPGFPGIYADIPVLRAFIEYVVASY